MDIVELDTAKEAAEEIRKLRGELQTVHAHLQHYRNLRTADQSEIARLREALHEVYTLAATMKFEPDAGQPHPLKDGIYDKIMRRANELLLALAQPPQR